MVFLHHCFAQTTNQEEDSLLHLIELATDDSIKANLYLELSELNYFNQPAAAVLYAQKSLDISKKNNYTELIGSSYLGLFMGHFYQGSSADTILSYIKRYEGHAKASTDQRKMMVLYWFYALYYNNLRQADKEVEYFLKALALAKRYSEDPETATGLLFNVGAALVDQQKYLEALPYLEKALAEVKGDGLKADILYALGEVYNADKQYEEAQTYFQRSFYLYERVKDKGKMALSMLEEGKYYDRNKQFERSYQLYLAALELVEKNEVNFSLPPVLSTLAMHFQQQGDHRSAIKYGELALAEINKQKNYKKLDNTYELLQESYAAIGDYRKAYQVRGEYMIFKDSVKSAELLTKVKALTTQFDLEQKETENELLKMETAANERTIQSRNITILAFLLGMLLIGSWAIVVFRSNRRKQRYNEKLQDTVAARTAELQQANYELSMFNYIASHDIKEPIRNIGSFVGLIFKKLPDPLQIDLKQYFKIIEKSTAQLYTLIEDFSRYAQMSKDKDLVMQTVELDTIVDGISMNLNQLLKEKNGIIINDGLPIIKTSSSFIYTILKNIIENGLKFNQSNQPVIQLSARDHARETEIIIEDNGIGIDQVYQEKIFELFQRLHNRKAYDGSGVGLAIVKLLMDKMGGTVKIESELGKGSRFILLMPKER